MHDAAEARSAPGAQELLSAPQFFEMLRHVVGFRAQPAIADPLQGAVDQIANNPAFAQSRLLMRILVALPSQLGEFRRAEVTALDASTRSLVIALLDLHASAARSTTDWSRAIAAAQAGSA